MKKCPHSCRQHRNGHPGGDVQGTRNTEQRRTRGSPSSRRPGKGTWLTRPLRLQMRAGLMSRVSRQYCCAWDILRWDASVTCPLTHSIKTGNREEHDVYLTQKLQLELLSGECPRNTVKLEASHTSEIWNSC